MVALNNSAIFLVSISELVITERKLQENQRVKNCPAAELKTQSSRSDFTKVAPRWQGIVPLSVAVCHTKALPVRLNSDHEMRNKKKMIKVFFKFHIAKSSSNYFVLFIFN
jgi:hypothetical protein